MEKISGQFYKIIYQNSTNYYTVCLFTCEDELLTVCGQLQDILFDDFYDLYGDFTEHPKYGFQFHIQSYEKKLPSDKELIIQFLSSNIFKGIGKKMAEKIVDYYQEDVFEKIQSNPTSLLSIKGMSSEKVNTLLEGIKQYQNDEDTHFLIQLGLSLQQSQKIKTHFQTDIKKLIKENPYRLFYEINGFTFEKAHQIAKQIGFSESDVICVEASLYEKIRRFIFQTGDGYIERQSFLVHDTLLSALAQYQLIAYDENKIFLKEQYDAICYIADYCTHFLLFQLESLPMKKIEEALLAVENTIQITYDTIQREAIVSLMENDFLVLTGGPGTGKTTVIKGIVQIIKYLYPHYNVMCVTPTGRAAKRLMEICETKASTIHSLLKYNLESQTFQHDAQNPIQVDVLIIDEFSMVDNWLFYNLLLASASVKKICIIGDPNQLPSIAPGCLLKDFIDANQFKVIALDKVYRQKKGSGVIALSRQILTHTVSFESIQEDVFFYECDSATIPQKMIQMIQKMIDKGYFLKDIQVLSSMYRGYCGIDNLNHVLQDAFNPHQENYRIGNTSYRLNDRVIQLKNQPDDGVFNGDIGTIVAIDLTSEEILMVDFDGTIVAYTKETVANIQLAYAISVHKSQGSEYSIVMIPIVKEQMYMLDKKLLYTAVTRSKSILILLGDKSVFLKGIAIKEKHTRKSIFKEILLEKISQSTVFD